MLRQIEGRFGSGATRKSPDYVWLEEQEWVRAHNAAFRNNPKQQVTQAPFKIITEPDGTRRTTLV